MGGPVCTCVHTAPGLARGGGAACEWVGATGQKHRPWCEVRFFHCPLLLALNAQIVLGPEANLRGYDGVRTAGFWGSHWDTIPRASYVSC